MSPESRDLQIILPPGILRIHSSTESTSTTSMKKDDKAKRTLPQNTSEYLREHFLNIDSLYNCRIEGRGAVLTIEPSKAYSYGSVMVVAMHEELVSGTSQKQALVETYNIYDYNYELQKEYFRQILAGIKAHIYTELPHCAVESDPRAIAVENTQVKISDFEHKMARSIALPHANVIKIGDWIDSTTPAPRDYGFRKEQKYTQSQELFHEFKEFFYSNLCDEISNHSGVITDIQQRGVPPYGYTLSTSMNLNDFLVEQAEVLSFLLGKNHNLYKNFVLQRIEKESRIREFKHKQAGYGKPKRIEDQIIPQPSYRTYIYFINGQLRITISPAIFSTAGVIEAAEIFSIVVHDIHRFIATLN